MARDDPHFRLRLPAELKEAIEQEARNSGRSINAEIVFRLEQSVEGFFLDMTSEHFVALMNRFQATQEALEELYFDCRDIDLDHYIVAHSEDGERLTRPKAIRKILRDYLETNDFLAKKQS